MDYNPEASENEAFEELKFDEIDNEGCIASDAKNEGEPDHGEPEPEGEVDEDQLICRYCLGNDNEENLIVPCKCRGSSRYVHRNCLDNWRIQGVNDQNFKRCNECRFEYTLISNFDSEEEAKRYREFYKNAIVDTIFFVVTVICFVILFAIILYYINLEFGCFKNDECPGNSLGTIMNYMSMIVLVSSFAVGIVIFYMMSMYNNIIASFYYRSNSKTIVTFIGFVTLMGIGYYYVSGIIKKHKTALLFRHEVQIYSVKDYKDEFPA